MASIFVVDDEDDIRELLKYNLEKEGHKVTVLENGLACIEAVSNNKPDLIILDVMMPGMDGIEVCENLKQNPDNNVILICFLTARSEDYSQIAGLESGGDDYVAKPFSVEELQLRMKALLKRVNIKTTLDEEKIIQLGKYTFDVENYTLTINGEKKTLTKKEAHILKVLYKFKNQVVPREVILNAVWGQDDYFIGRSFDVFITKLRKYLKEDTSIKISNVHGVGFKFELQA